MDPHQIATVPQLDAPLIAIMLLVLALLAPVTFIILMCNRRKPFRPDRVPAVTKGGPSTALLISGYLTFLIFGPALMAFAGPAGPWGMILTFMLGSSLVAVVVAANRKRSLEVFSVLGAAVRQNLPLPQTLETEAASLKGIPQDSFLNIANCLRQGMPLSEAVERGYPSCPGYAIGLLSAAERVDQVPRAIAAIEKRLSHSNHRWYVRNRWFGYPIAVVALFALIMMILGIFVLPKLQEILRGASIPMRPEDRLVFVLSEAGPALLGVLVAMTVLVIPATLRIMFRPRRANTPQLPALIGDGIKWHLPLWNWLERARARYETAEFLKTALASGVGVDQAIEGACQLDLNAQYIKRLKKWLRLVRQGEDVSAAARSTGVGSAIAWAFDSRFNPANAESVLDVIDSAGRAAYDHAKTVISSITWPTASLLMAASIGFVAYRLMLSIWYITEWNVYNMMP